MKLQGIQHINAILTAVAVAAVLGGCSAGGKSESLPGSSTSTAPGTITESLSSSTATSVAPVTVSATVRTGTGAPVAGTVVTFATGAIGSLSSATALTNSSGIASVTLSPASATSSGADTVTATATVGANTVTASQGYQANATTAQVSSVTSDSTGALSAYGQAVLTVTMTGVTAALPATLAVTSQCVTAGKATISPATVNATSNTATFTYKDSGGCGSILAADTVTASIGTGSSKSTQITLTSPTPNSITFSSATPKTIYLKGSGNTESSNVVFQVVDTDGNALPGQKVTLALSTQAGGLTIDQTSGPVTATSDANGFVTAIINSGTVPTPVRVTATLASGVSTVSSVLSVATGLPSQLHFSLSAATFNVEGANIDGTTDSFTVRAADRSGNPVPDGTSVLFWAEGGQIQATALTSTSGGISSATANFVTQDYRPADGRITVLAYAIGEESFIDLYGTNVYQAADATHPQADPFQDLGDIVKSRLYDNIYDPTNDEVISLSLTGSAAGTSACTEDTTNYPQFALDQSTPVKPGTCDGQWSAHTYVRKATEIVFSTSAANPIWSSKAGLPASCTADRFLHIAPQSIDTTTHAFYSIAANPVWYTGSGAASGAFTIIAADGNTNRLNPMAAGTRVSASADDTTIAVFTATGGTQVVNTTEATGVNISYKFIGGATSATGVLTFVSPSGLSTSLPFAVNLGSPASACP